MGLKDDDKDRRMQQGKIVEEHIRKSLERHVYFNDILIIILRAATPSEDMYKKWDAVAEVDGKQISYQFKYRDPTNRSGGDDLQIAFIRGKVGASSECYDLPDRRGFAEILMRPNEFATMLDRDVKTQVDFWGCLNVAQTEILVVEADALRRIVRDIFKEYTESNFEFGIYDKCFKSSMYKNAELRIRYDTRDGFWKMLCYVPKDHVRPIAQIIEYQKPK